MRMKCPECGLKLEAIPLDEIRTFRDGLEILTKHGAESRKEFFKGALWICEVLLKLAEED